MKRLILSLFLLMASLMLHGQNDFYVIECVSCEPVYGETDCSTCPGNSGVGVTLFDGIIIRNRKTDEELAYIPRPFKPKLSGGYVEIYTQTSDEEVNGLPTQFKAKFEEYVLSDYSKYDSFLDMVDSLSICGACSAGQSDSDTARWYSYESSLTAGQTSITIPFTPVDDSGIFFFLNGQALGSNDWNRTGNIINLTSHIGLATDYIIIKTYQ